MVTAATLAAIQQLLRDRPDLDSFYMFDIEYTDGSTGYLTFHSLVAEPAECQSAIQSICRQLSAEIKQEIAELNALPEEEQPYGPMLAAACVVSLCMLLPGRRHYVPIQRQRWALSGHSQHAPSIPDIFDLPYYRHKVQYGEYHHNSVIAL